MTNINVGRFGVWRRWQDLTPELAKDIEDLGYGTIWIGASPSGDLEIAERLLAATDRIVIATGIVNMWATPAEEAAASYHRLVGEYGDRFLLGAGIGHREMSEEYRTPYQTMVDYLDRLDAAKVPASGRALAALGPKALRLAAERAAGAHPYLTTPEHTRKARQEMGEGPLLAPEQKFVLDADPERARAVARANIGGSYLLLSNYTANLRRLGWSEEDIADGGSDALVDALVLHGDADAVAARLGGHFEAGADHVAVQPLFGDAGADPLPALRELAAALKPAE
ncbi:LLM class F420-dependent oxidoreductase [Actinomadura terrae]|uniref:LLM class F420-dependent oxidoreductase n=1 Tax=Actinomadura terrae TaxID=604353 RepID=UPI001FA72D76|nr:LLM class F420-dependent oxidoreductase [Actinomadura terrae]